jgi:uncharacterized protein (DUF2141 family)
MRRVLSRAWVVLVMIALLLGTAVGGDGVGSVVVTIEGFRNPEGRARVALFSQESGFPDDESGAYRKIVSDIRNGAVQVRFDELPAGSYALSTYHDENGDAKFNKGLFGIPKEGYGVSNNIVHATRAPKFGEAVFPLSNEVKDIRIQVHY